MLVTKEIVLSREGEEPKFIPLDKNPFRIGRSPVNELPLQKRTIPRHQCDIIETETGFKLLDRSGKGTVVDGKKVKEAELTDEAVIKIGGHQFRIRDIPAEAVGTVTAVYGGTDPKASRGSKKTVLSLGHQ